MANKINFKNKEYSINEAREMFMKMIEGAKPEVKELAELVVKKQGVGSGAGRQVNSKTNIFRQLILADKKVSEDKIWTTFKWGKHEALSSAWGFRKKGEPKDFLWINFERDDKGIGNYVLKGQGPEAPKSFIDKTKKVTK